MAIDPRTSQMLQQLFAQLAQGGPGGAAGGPAGIATVGAAPARGVLPPAFEYVPSPTSPGFNRQQVNFEAAAHAAPSMLAPPLEIGNSEGFRRVWNGMRDANERGMRESAGNQRAAAQTARKAAPNIAESTAVRPQFPMYGVGKAVPTADLLGIGLPMEEGGDPKGKMVAQQDMTRTGQPGPVSGGLAPRTLYNMISRAPNEGFVPSNSTPSDPLWKGARALWTEGKDQYIADVKASPMKGSERKKYLQKVAPRGSSRWGEVGIPYVDVLNDAYGAPKATQLIQALRELYAKNQGGAMAATDINTPLPIAMEYVESPNTLGLHNPQFGITINPVAAAETMNAADRVAAGNPRGGDKYQIAIGKPDIIDTFREEMGHKTANDARNADPNSPWSRFLLGNINAGAFNRPSDATNPTDAYWPFLEDTYSGKALREQEMYPSRLEEARAKLVKTAQGLGNHPLLHPGGLDAGIKDMFQRLEQKYTDPKTGKISAQKSAQDADAVHYLYKWMQSEKDPAIRQSYMQLLREVFSNWASNDLGRQMGISLPEMQRA